MHDGKVWIVDWKDERHEMTPEELLERIRTDSESDFDWLAPANEIVRTVTDSDFPENIANELKVIVLTCFAHLLLSNVRGNEKSDDYLAVAYCYYTVHGDAGKKAKKLYRKNLVRAVVSANSHYDLRHREQFRRWQRKWQEFVLGDFTELFGKEIYRWESNIDRFYKASEKAAEDAGMFAEDEKSYHKSMEATAHAICKL